MELVFRSDRAFKLRLRAINEAQIRNEMLAISGFNLNDVVYRFIKSIISKHGKEYQVINCKIPGRRFKAGYCYYNSIELIKEKNWQYVEGIAICKSTGRIICHAWNIDENGCAVDVTFKDAHRYDYIGIIVPYKLIFQVGLRVGGHWYCSLPYLKY